MCTTTSIFRNIATGDIKCAAFCAPSTTCGVFPVPTDHLKVRLTQFFLTSDITVAQSICEGSLAHRHIQGNTTRKSCLSTFAPSTSCLSTVPLTMHVVRPLSL